MSSIYALSVCPSEWFNILLLHRSVIYVCSDLVFEPNRTQVKSNQGIGLQCVYFINVFTNTHTRSKVIRKKTASLW